MEQNGWIKLYRKILRDEKVRSLSTARRWIWVTMLLMASQDEDTMGEMRWPDTRRPYSLDDIAEASGELKMTVSRAVKQLESLGMIERLSPPRGRMPGLVKIVKFTKYQSPRSVTPGLPEPRSVTACVTPSVTDSVAPGLHNDPGSPENEQGTLALEVEEVEETSAPQDTSCPSGILDDPDRTDEQRCIRRCFETLTGLALPNEFPKGRPYTTAASIVADCGIDDCDYWLSQQSPNGVPDGAEAWRWFCQQFKGARHVKLPWGWREEAEKRRREGLSEERQQQQTDQQAQIDEEAARRQAWDAACKEFPEGFVRWKVLRATDQEHLDEMEQKHRGSSQTESYRALLGALEVEMTSMTAKRATSRPSPS